MSTELSTRASPATPDEIVQDILVALGKMTEWELRKTAYVLGIRRYKTKEHHWSNGRRFNNIDDAEVQENYLDALSRTGRYAAAAEASGVHIKILQVYRREHPDFQAKCDVALEMYRDEIIMEAKRRAVDGYERPIIGGRNKDEIVAYETVYSDRLLELFLKSFVGEGFGEKLDVTVDVPQFREQVDFKQLSPRARSKLRELLLIVKEDNEQKLLQGEDGTVEPPGQTIDVPVEDED